MYIESSTRCVTFEELTHFVELLERCRKSSLSSQAIAQACPVIYEQIPLTGQVLGTIGLDQTVWWKDRYLIPLAWKNVSYIRNANDTKLSFKQRIIQITLPKDKVPSSFLHAVHQRFFASQQPHPSPWYALDNLIHTIEENLYPLQAVEEIYQALLKRKDVLIQCPEEQKKHLYTTLECLERQMDEGITYYKKFFLPGTREASQQTKLNLRTQVLQYTTASLILLDQHYQYDNNRIEKFKKQFPDHLDLLP